MSDEEWRRYSCVSIWKLFTFNCGFSTKSKVGKTTISSQIFFRVSLWIGQPPLKMKGHLKLQEHSLEKGFTCLIYLLFNLHIYLLINYLIFTAEKNKIWD